MNCPSCGAPASAGMNFCVRCGVTLPVTPADPAAPGAPLAAAAPAFAMPPARPTLTAGELLSFSMRRALGEFRLFLGTQGVLLLLGSAVGIALTMWLVLPYADDFAALDPADISVPELLGTLGRFAGLTAVVALVGFFFQTIAVGLGVVVADALDRGERLGLAEAWRRLQPRLGNLLATAGLAALAAVGVMVGGALLFFLIVPIFAALAIVVYLLVKWAVFGPVSVLEQRTASENLKRAGRITQGARGAIFGAALLLVLASIAPTLVVSSFAGLMGADPAAPTPTWLYLTQSIAGALVQLVTSIVGTVLVVRAYRELAPSAPV